MDCARFIEMIFHALFDKYFFETEIKSGKCTLTYAGPKQYMMNKYVAKIPIKGNGLLIRLQLVTRASIFCLQRIYFN